MAVNPSYLTEVVLAVTALTTTLADGQWWGSAEIDVETDDNAIDHVLGGNMVMGTSPTAGGTFDVYLAARWADGTNDYQGSIGTGLPRADAEGTPDTHFVEDNLTPARAFIVTGTTGHNIKWSIGGVAQYFGGVLPPAYCVLIENNTGVALGSGSEVNYVPFTVADV